MKTKLLFLAAMATFALTSCVNDEFIGDPAASELGASDGSIGFGFNLPNQTRADLYGSDAAAKLGNKFVVYGTKHASAEDKTAANDVVVFNNYQVAWTANTAGTTASNSSDWDYVGLASYTAPAAGGTSSQAIKYWDRSTVAYTFTAFSYDPAGITYPKDGADKVAVTKTTSDGTSLYNKGYEVIVANTADLNKLYFSDRVYMEEANYDKIVNFTFRNIGAKVRFGFYETIPGYTVKIDKFYIDGDASAVVTAFSDMNVAKTDGFYASLQNVDRTADQTLKVTYYDAGTVINRPKFAGPAATYAWSLKLGNGSGLINTNLATSSASPTWAVAAGEYTAVFPFEANTNPLLLKLDFTLTPEDGSADVIHVRGARAIVPVEYVKWKSNFAYTYIFKISDMTNGTTGAVDVNGDPTEPEGLKAITFDGLVVDMAEEWQQTITTVSTNSITTYAEGEITDEYKKGKAIYVAITDNGTAGRPVITPSALGAAAGNAQIYKITAGSATEASFLAHLNGLPMGITKETFSATIETTVPLVDGTTPAISNVKFTPDAAGTYAYVYTRTAYVAPTYENQGSAAYNDGAAPYYMRSGAPGSYVYFPVPVADAAAFNENKANLYLQTGAGTPGVYDVKIIKVID